MMSRFDASDDPEFNPYAGLKPIATRRYGITSPFYGG